MYIADLFSRCINYEIMTFSQSECLFNVIGVTTLHYFANKTKYIVLFACTLVNTHHIIYYIHGCRVKPCNGRILALFHYSQIFKEILHKIIHWKLLSQTYSYCTTDTLYQFLWCWNTTILHVPGNNYYCMKVTHSQTETCFYTTRLKLQDLEVYIAVPCE